VRAVDGGSRPALLELQTISYANGGTSLGSITYGYDGNSRRISRNSTIDHNGLPSPVNLAKYDAANRLTQWGNQSFSYDNNGNLTSDGATTYGWNARNQLASLSGGATASFAYDGLGRRRGRTVGGASTSFVYDGINLVQEQLGSGNANYLTGLGIDETYSRTDSNGTTSYLTDALGSTVGLSGSTGNTVTGYNYDAYGNTTTTGTTSANSIQYAGRENDGTGLYFNRARYFSPKLGRFISRDPIGLDGGINTYAYVGGNPINYIDPLGLWSLGFQSYSGFGGGVVLAGEGLHFTSITFRGGVGVGVGIDFNPWGGPPDEKAPCHSDSIGVFAEGELGLGPLGVGQGVNYGGTRWFDQAGRPHWQEYGGREPEYGLGKGSGGWPIHFGLEYEAEASAGVEVTHHF